MAAPHGTPSELYQATEHSRIASIIPDARKRALLLSFSEDDFRDKVVRPLYRRLGLRHVRETCGADEEGKDCLFMGVDPTGDEFLIAVQTKKGPLTMSGSKPTDSLTVADNQVQMALDTPVIVNGDSTKITPGQVHLVCSGRISKSVHEKLFDKFGSQRVKVWGSDELIERIDKHFPELWLGFDVEKFPYARTVRKQLCLAADAIKLSDVTGDEHAESPVLDQNYIALHLTRLEEHRVRKNKRTFIESRFVDISVEALINKRHRLVLIMGEGGMGKTTALRRLAYTMVERVLASRDAAPLPVSLKAQEVADSKVPVMELAANIATEIGQGKCPFGSYELDNGLVAVLVDALDEVAAGHREKVLERISAFHAAYPKCLIVITSRDYKSILSLSQIARFVHYRLLPITIREADKIVTRAMQKKTIDPAVARSTLRKLSEAHGVNLSPMLVTVFLASSDFSKQDLPPNITEIFKKFTELMLGRWDQRKGLKQQHEATFKDFLLKKLAFHMHQGGTRTIEANEVRRLFADELRRRELDIDSDTVFDEIVVRSGLLNSDGRTVEWRHHLLQEFFAGRGVPDASFLADVVAEDWWRSPIVFYFGDKPDAVTDLQRLVDRAKKLSGAKLFDAAVTLGMAAQSCYLLETHQKVKVMNWVLEALAKSMEAFRKAAITSVTGPVPLMTLVVAYALGRDAVGTRTIAKIAAGGKDSVVGVDLFDAIDPERLEFWRLVGLLESGELEVASKALAKYRTGNKELIFGLTIAIGWVLHLQKMDSDIKRRLEAQQQALGEIVSDMKEAVFLEFKTLLFEYRRGRLATAESIEESIATEKASLEASPGDAEA